MHPIGQLAFSSKSVLLCEVVYFGKRWDCNFISFLSISLEHYAPGVDQKWSHSFVFECRDDNSVLAFSRAKQGGRQLLFPIPLH